jgi:hypothetical protein
MSMVPSPDPALTYVTIDDFRPGIISQSKFAYQANDNSAPVPWLGKPGAAQQSGTVGCIALPNGGLAPLPGIVKTVATGYTPPAGVTGYINGAIIYGMGGGNEILYGIEAKGGGTRSFQLTSYIDATTTTTAVQTFGPAADTTATGIAPLTGALTRVNPTDPTQPGQPCVALAYTFVQNSGATQNNWLYPNPGATGSFDLYEFSPSYNSLCLTHQNRVVELTLFNYPWVGTVGGQATFFATNETFNYTDPPNSEDMGAQNEVFVEEDPGGVGAWGSISAGELFLVKNAGGGFIVSGDLNSPTITYLGGVTPTYGTLSDAAQTVVGLVYASNNNGVWAWQGGMTSQKLSPNLNDDFWQLNSAGSVGFSASDWGDWVAMTNGWVFDTLNGGWWQLTNPGFTPLYYGTTADGTGMWAVADSFLHASDPIIAKYDHSGPATLYTWKSYPLAQTKDRNLSIQEVILRAQGSGTVTITYEGVGGSGAVTQPVTFDITEGTQPQMIRSNVGTGTGTFQAQDITVAISSSGTSGGPAPIVYSVTSGFLETTPVNSA